MSTSQRFNFIPTVNKIDKYITVKIPKDSFFNKLSIDNIEYNKSSFLVVKKDTLEGYTLQNIVIANDTIKRATIGVLDKGMRTEIYIDSIFFKENSQFKGFRLYSGDKSYKKQLKKYKVDMIDLLKK
ncbi:hypothetical protein GCM10022393_14830 [Aquimarina addita]|uniref:Uncharacterized protein n=1 Tax=Aquimarina addita TaxID=870485 RepID=A0ABP7XFU7_9FLAO